MAVALMPHFEKEAKERQIRKTMDSVKANLPERDKGQARDHAAKAMKVSGRMVQDAKRIQAEAPKMFEKIKADSITVNEAKREIRHEKAREDSRRAVKVVAAIVPKKFTANIFLEVFGPSFRTWMGCFEP